LSAAAERWSRRRASISARTSVWKAVAATTCKPVPIAEREEGWAGADCDECAAGFIGDMYDEKIAAVLVDDAHSV
jgi:hypothetical protein